MKNFRNIIALALIALAFTACKKTKYADPGNAELRLVNTVQSLNSQFIYQENVKLTNNSVGYGLYSDFMRVTAGYSMFWTKDSQTDLRTAITDALLYNNYYYTLFLYQTADGNPMLTGYINQQKQVAEGKFRVRFVQLSTSFNGRALDVNDRNGDGISRGLNFGDNPVYIELPLSTIIRINVRDEGDLTEIPASTFESKKTYTVWFDSENGTHVNYHIVPED